MLVCRKTKKLIFLTPERAIWSIIHYNVKSKVKPIRTYPCGDHFHTTSRLANKRRPEKSKK